VSAALRLICAAHLKPVLTRHVSAIVEPDQVGDLMRAIDGYHGQLVTRAALWLSAMLFQRPGNIRQMEWGELDLDEGRHVGDTLRQDEADKAGEDQRKPASWFRWRSQAVAGSEGPACR
jgi:integrase